MTLHLKDEVFLNKICEFFKGAGSIYRFGEDKISYRVNRLEELLTIIIPHFKLYPLKTNKQKDFELFLKAVEYINKKEHLTEGGLEKLVAIRASLNLGLSDRLKAAFPLCEPVPRPELVVRPLNPQWVAGFTSGDGYFGVKLCSSRTIKTGVQVNLVFSINST
ncbi:MAG: LAGLIDADG family homing endonuclease [Rickettsia endosymbiont of Ixodes persulcatus]|nr:LAGLIDADG family homing endonuclease [Rickettsia endosymbiont of Ixodes persulcatus]